MTAIVDADDGFVLEVETVPSPAGCPGCGVLAEHRGRRVHRLADAPAFGRPVQIAWRKRTWRCREPKCAVGTFSETHPFAPPRAKLTARAVAWAAGMLRTDDTTVSALARRLGVGWHTLWRAIAAHTGPQIADPIRLHGVATLGVDEHIVRREALLFRMEVRDHHRRVVVAAR